MAANPYDQDVIAPTAIYHRVEFGDRDPDVPGQFGYWYNYIDYDFAADDRVVTARHYLDEPRRALLLGKPIEDDLMLLVLQFLLMRYDTLEWLGPEGYVAVPAPIMNEARNRLDRHLARADG